MTRLRPVIALPRVSRRGHLHLLLVVAALLAPVGLRAESSPTEIGKGHVAGRPGEPDAPTRVAVGVYLLDIAQVDDVDQTLRVDLVLWASWHDGRLISRHGRRYGLGEIWHPRVQILNERSLDKQLPDELRVSPEGQVLYVQRLSGTVFSKMNLADFPFDEQRFEIRVFAGGYAREEVELTVEAGRTGRSDGLSIADWAVGPLIADTAVLEYTPDGRDFLACVYSFDAKRSASFYVWKVILPLVIIVFLSWTVFWIDPSTGPPQLSLAATSILALIAYQFVLGGLVPRLSYLTRQDRFLIASTILVVAAMVEVLVTTRLASVGKCDLAVKIDRWSRIAFPIAFVVVIAIVFQM